MQVVTTSGQLTLLQQKRAYLATLRMSLFTNPIVPVSPQLRSSWAEPTVAGYTPTLVPSMGVPYTNAGGFGEIDASSIVAFTPTVVVPGGVNIYGYFLWDPANTPNQCIVYEFNPAGVVNWATNLIPYVVQYSMQESQFNPSAP